MGRFPRASSAVVLLALFGAALSCGGDDEPASTATPGTVSPSPLDGPSPLEADQVIDLASEQPVSVIWGADEGDFLNDLPLLAGGDVNGDGVEDLLIGARFGDGPDNSRTDGGEAYVIFGSGDLPDSVDLAEGEQDVTIYGASGQTAGSPNGDQLGFSGLLADVNGDGIDDVLVGSPFVEREDSGAEAGAIYIFFGGPDLDGEIDLATAEADVTLVGRDSSGFFGDSVASTDVTGDGVDDLIIGAAFTSNQAGAVYLVFGSQELAGTRDMARGEFDAVVLGAEFLDELGDNVGGADINDDGLGDIIMTAEAADGPDNARSVAAEVYVVYGSPDLGGEILIAQGGQDVTIYGAEENDTIGFNLASGDLNGDGVADMILVARLADGPGNAVPEGGEVHVIFGSSSLPEVIDLATEGSSVYVYGPDAADQLGAAVGTADFDGDGTDELLAGTSFGNGPSNTRPDGGEFYALNPDTLEGTVDLTKAAIEIIAYGAGAGDRLGAALTVGDLNGDGALELVLLASQGGGPGGSRPGAGQVYVVTPGG